MLLDAMEREMKNCQKCLLIVGVQRQSSASLQPRRGEGAEQVDDGEEDQQQLPAFLDHLSVTVLSVGPWFIGHERTLDLIGGE